MSSAANWNISSNRINRTLTKAVDRANDYISTLDSVMQIRANHLIENTYLSYTDTWKKTPDPDHPTLPTIKLLDRRITDYISDKQQLGEKVLKYGLLDYAPRSYNSVKEALDSNTDDRVLFVKGKGSTAGKQVSCIRYTDLPNFDLKPNYIIQEAISNIELYENKKMVFRFFILIFDKQIFLNKHSFAVIHGVDYNADSTDYQVQVQHHGDDGNTVIRFPLTNLEKYNLYITSLIELSNKIKPILEDVQIQSSKDRYILLGCDGIPCQDGKIRLVEINTYPNLLKPPVDMLVNMPMFSSMMLKLVTDINDGSWITVNESTV